MPSAELRHYQGPLHGLAERLHNTLLTCHPNKHPSKAGPAARVGLQDRVCSGTLLVVETQDTQAPASREDQLCRRKISLDLRQRPLMTPAVRGQVNRHPGNQMLQLRLHSHSHNSVNKLKMLLPNNEPVRLPSHMHSSDGRPFLRTGKALRAIGCTS